MAEFDDFCSKYRQFNPQPKEKHRRILPVKQAARANINIKVRCIGGDPTKALVAFGD